MSECFSVPSVWVAWLYAHSYVSKGDFSASLRTTFIVSDLLHNYLHHPLFFRKPEATASSSEDEDDEEEKPLQMDEGATKGQENGSGLGSSSGSGSDSSSSGSSSGSDNSDSNED